MAIFILWIGMLSRLDPHVLSNHFKVLTVFGALAGIATIVIGTRFTAPIGHVSYLSDFLLLLLPCAAYSLLRAKTPAARALFLSCGVFLFYLLWQTATRASILACALQAVLALSFSVLYSIRAQMRPRNALTIIAFPVALTAAVSSILLFPLNNFRDIPTVSRLQQTVQLLASSQYSQLEERWQVWIVTLQAASERWLFGWGYGNFRYAYAQENPDHFLRTNSWIMHPHNELLAQFFEGGAVGLALFTALALMICIPLLKKALTRDPADPDRPYAACLFTGLASFLFSIQFSTTFTNAVIRAVLIVYLAAAYQMIRPRLPVYRLNAPAISKPLTLGLGIGMILLGLVAAGNSLASLFLQQAQRELGMTGSTRKHQIAQSIGPASFQTLLVPAQIDRKMGNIAAAESAFKEGIRVFPHIPHFHLDLGALYMQTNRFPEAKRVFLELAVQHPSYPLPRDYLRQIEQLELSR